MKSVTFITILAILIATACKESFLENVQRIDKVTGIAVTDHNGMFLKDVGNPNISHNGIYVYPNPANHRLYIKSDQIIKKVWLVKGNVDYSHSATDFDQLLKSHQYNQEEISSISLFQTPVNAKEYNFDIRGFNERYFRVFMLIENDFVKWSNIVKTDRYLISDMLDDLEEEWNE